MRLALRFGIPLLVVLVVTAAALTPLTSQLVNRWFQHDLEIRSRLIFSTMRDSLSRPLNDARRSELDALFARIAQDERILALGWCTTRGKPDVASSGWPAILLCPDESPLRDPIYRNEDVGRGHVLYAAFPVAEEGGSTGSLVVLHDLGFIESRSLAAQFYLAAFLVLLGVCISAVTILTAHMTLRGWIRSIGQMLNTPSDKPIINSDPQIAPVISGIRQLIRDLDISRRTAEGIRVDWSPKTLKLVLDSELPGTQVMVVSNREPYIHNHSETGEIVMQRPASGLVTAFEPIMRACGGTWIAHGSGSADREVVDAEDRIAVPPEAPAYTLKRVWLSPEEEEGYYYGLSNEGLWPLCHITFVRPIFRQSDWDRYVAVNQKFADMVVNEATCPNPIVLVQDYHFALLPRLIRERMPQATIITFWHIPWPNSEVFSVCPWREAILDGLLGSSIIGFHTQLHCNNFIESADRFIESHIDREEASVSVRGHTAQVRPYPISIAWPPPALTHVPSVAECRKAIFRKYNLPSQTLLAVGVERFDFTKGIADRFRAVDLLLKNHPEWIGRLVMLQVAAPTRAKLPIYADIQREAAELAVRINARFTVGAYKPIILVVEHHEPEQVYELFRAADICIVSSLHDGMNLVAKEFVAARDDEQGTLVLSTFAGASRELMEALLVNPFDARATAETINTALKMPPPQQAERMKLMRSLIAENNVYYWAGRMLLDAARIRKRSNIEAAIAAATVQPPSDRAGDKALPA